MRRTRKTLIRLTALLCMLCITGTASAGTLTIPTGVTTIEQEAFENTAATCVVIPESTETIVSRAFADSDSLTDVYLPAKTITIAEDAFDRNPSLTFHVYMGSDNANWALDRGYQVEYTSGDIGAPASDAWNQVNTLIATEAVSLKNDDPYYTYRLIVKLTDGSEMPDLSSFNPKAVVRISNALYVLQFSNDIDTERCANALKAWTAGCAYCEADYFLSYIDTNTANNDEVVSASINSDDPMGFSAYTGFIGSNAGNITIAVIDDGVSSGMAGCSVSNNSFDFINNQSGAKNYGNSHGTKVANAISEAFGALTNHLTIASYRIENPSNGEISYILMGEALIRAKDDGCSFANISIAGESTYDNHQQNQFLRECISYFGSNRVIAAAGNHAASANNYLPGRYCIKAGAAQLDENGQLVRANGTATGANYSGYATTTSIAAGKVTAALALTQLGSDDISLALEDVQDGARMPDLSKLAIKLVDEIILDGGDLPSSITIEVGDPLNIQYAVEPSDATNPAVTAVSSNTSVIAERNHDSRYYRFTAKAPGNAEITFTSQDGNAIPVILHVAVRQPVTSITVTGDTGETLMKDETIPLYATVLPENASDKSLLWHSSNEDIATVSETGVVMQKGEGTVTITAQSRSDPDVVSDPVSIVCTNESRGTGVTVNPEGNITIIYLKDTEETVQMHANILPEDANQAVTWSVDRPEIAEIDENGVLTAKAPGDVIVTARSENYNISGFVGLTVVQLPTSVTIFGENTVDIGKTIQLSATVAPENAQDKSLTWSSGDPSIAEVDENGIVTGMGAGNVAIIAASNANPQLSRYYIITVTVPPIIISINTPGTTVLDIGGSVLLSTTITPANTSNKTVTWISSDTSVATVDANGVVTARASGTVIIVASTYNGITDSITFTVRQPYSLVFNANDESGNTTGITAYSGYAIGNVLPTPTRDYYSFVGWFTASSGGSQVTSTWSTTCSTSYTIYAHWTEKPWSTDWVDPNEVPSNARIVSTKTQYRYRDQYASYSDWSEWGLWKETRQSITDANLMEEQTATKRKWWAAECKKCGRHNPYWGKDSSGNIRKCASCKAQMTSSNTNHVCYYTDDTSGSTIDGRENGRYYDGKLYWLTSDKPTCYRYRTRTVTYPWGNWTDWNDNYVSASDTRQVETRTRVRYQYK